MGVYVFFFSVFIAIALYIVLAMLDAPQQAEKARVKLIDANKGAERLRLGEKTKQDFELSLMERGDLCRCQTTVGTAYMLWDKENEEIIIMPFAMDRGGYETYDAFRPGPPSTYHLSDLFLAEIRRTNIKEVFYRTEIVPVSIENKKSLIGRALVGGFLLGPAGAMVGVASGLGGKSHIENDERQVRDERMVSGHPKLVLGIKGKADLISLLFDSEAELEYLAKTLSEHIRRRDRIN